MTVGWLDLIHLVGAAQGIFLAALFFFQQKGNTVANRFLALLLLVFSLRLFEIVAFWTHYLIVEPHLFLATYSLIYLFGPLFYLYVRNATGETTGRVWMHFLPFLLCLLYMIPFYLLSSEIKLLIIEQNVYGDPVADTSVDWLRLSFYLAQFPHVLIYLMLGIQTLKQANGRDTGRTAFLRSMAAGFGLFFGLWFAYNLLIWWGIPYQRYVDVAVTMCMTFSIYAIGYAAFQKPQLFRNGLKYRKSTLTREKAAESVAELSRIMASESLYRDPELKLPALAGQLGLSPNHLSQIINEELGLNFFDYLNNYRVQEAMRRLSDPDQRRYTLLSIAYEVGFNNKTSFNNAFKKVTGQTPSEFRAGISV